jgi:hypothetical protein
MFSSEFLGLTFWYVARLVRGGAWILALCLGLGEWMMGVNERFQPLL